MKFGFNDVFYSWIKYILSPTYLSITLNGAPKGYFNFKRCVRHGDPLSPFLFCLADDILSQSLSKLVRDGDLKRIKSNSKNSIPSHVLYAYDILIFCKANLSNIDSLTFVFTNYFHVSGQLVNPCKSSIFFGSICNAKVQTILNRTGFSRGSMPFNYLGVPLFKGKPKVSYFRPIADRILAKLSGWKGSNLSMAGRICLVKSVIKGILTHTILVYSWPVTLLTEIEKVARNFIWTTSIVKRKLCVAAWCKMCKLKSHGGLGFRSLLRLNEAASLKLA